MSSTDYTKQRQELLKRLAEEVPAEPITNASVLNKALLKASEIGILLSPVSFVDYIPQMHAVSFRYIFLN